MTQFLLEKSLLFLKEWIFLKTLNIYVVKKWLFYTPEQQTWKKLQEVLADILLKITIFLVKNPAFWTEDGGRWVEDQKLRMDEGKFRLNDREWRIKNSEMRLEGWGLRMHNTIKIWGFYHATNTFATNDAILRTFKYSEFSALGHFTTFSRSAEKVNTYWHESYLFEVN